MNKKTCAVVVTGIMSFVAPLAALAVSYTPPTALPLISVGTNGATVMRGTLDAVIAANATTFSVTSWGKSYTIDVTNLLPAKIDIEGYQRVAGDTNATLLPKFKAGDMIGLTGVMNSTGTIKAGYLHDWTTDRQATLDSVVIDGTMTGITRNASNLPNGFTLTGSIVALGSTVISNSPVKTYTVTVVNCTLTDSNCIPTLFMDYERSVKSTYSTLWAESDKVRIQANLLTGATDPRALVVRDLNIKGGAHII